MFQKEEVRMKKYFKKITAMLLVMGMLVTIMPMNVFATQSRSGNFSKSYTLTGNGAADMCAIALAQYQKTGSALGYTEDWCANFVSDCAKLAGQSKAVPAHGGVSYLYQNVINAGGKVVTTPQVGDLAFMDWNKGGGYKHVEIVYQVSGSTIYTIGGNSGPNTSSLYTSQVWKHSLSKTSGYFTKFVRPAYVTTVKVDKTPIGYLDSAVGDVDSIYVKGWAYDPDTTSKALEIKIYVDGEYIGSTVADKERTDVDKVCGCGPNHGYEATFEYDVEEDGTHKVEAYAVNTDTSGKNTLLTNSPKEVLVKADVEPEEDLEEDSTEDVEEETPAEDPEMTPDETPEVVEPDLIPDENVFSDVPKSQYYYEPVLWAVENGITSGLSETTFAPEASCTRGQVVTFLWRAKGCPEPTVTTHNFADLKENEYYYKAVLWAVENGITSGLTETTFAPDATVTRSQFVTLLYRAEGRPVCTGNNPFTDVVGTDYYYEPVLWAVENGITSGLTETTFAPEASCTRGQVVTFLYRAYHE